MFAGGARPRKIVSGRHSRGWGFCGLGSLGLFSGGDPFMLLVFAVG
jgi:hypothetical protein